jgi:hypothetical protein
MQSDLKRIKETASCAISIHSSFLTIRVNEAIDHVETAQEETTTDSPGASRPGQPKAAVLNSHRLGKQSF